MMFKFAQCEKCERQIVIDDTRTYPSQKVSEQLVLFDIHTGKFWYEMVKVG